MYAIAGGYFLLLASACVGFRLDDTRAGDFGIYGGSPINITEVPFMAMYRHSELYFGCGAGIVHERFLITAGHCVEKRINRVTVGADNAIIGGVDYEIEEVYRHPNISLNRTTFDFNVAVIKVKTKISFNDRVKPIKMADSSLIPTPGDLMQAIGFGSTKTNSHSKQLLSVKLPYVNLKKCQEVYKDWEIHPTPRYICAGGDAGKGSCSGDSGSPLIYKDTIIGITSWGNPCALKDYPTFYSYVPAMRDFIDNIIKNKA